MTAKHFHQRSGHALAFFLENRKLAMRYSQITGKPRLDEIVYQHNFLRQQESAAMQISYDVLLVICLSVRVRGVYVTPRDRNIV